MKLDEILYRKVRLLLSRQCKGLKKDQIARNLVYYIKADILNWVLEQIPEKKDETPVEGYCGEYVCPDNAIGFNTCRDLMIAKFKESE